MNNCQINNYLRLFLFTTKARVNPIALVVKSTAGPVSRVLFLPCGRPLSFIYDDCRQSPPAAYPPASGEQPSSAGIHGLATRRTYSREMSPFPRWALTPPFHPYRSRNSGGYFLLRLPDPRGSLPVRKDGALRCPDFPLPLCSGSDRAALRCGHKDNER